MRGCGFNGFSYSLPGAIGLLRIHRLVAGAARDSAPLHFPPIPQRRHPCRDLEDVVQGAFRVSWHCDRGGGGVLASCGGVPGRQQSFIVHNTQINISLGPLYVSNRRHGRVGGGEGLEGQATGCGTSSQSDQPVGM